MFLRFTDTSINRKLISAHRVATIPDVSDRIVTDDINKAQAFNSHFASVFNAMPSFLKTAAISNFKITQSSVENDFSPTNIFRALRNAKRSLSSGSMLFLQPFGQILHIR